MQATKSAPCLLLLFRLRDTRCPPLALPSVRSSGPPPSSPPSQLTRPANSADKKTAPSGGVRCAYHVPLFFGFSPPESSGLPCVTGLETLPFRRLIALHELLHAADVDISEV